MTKVLNFLFEIICIKFLDKRYNEKTPDIQVLDQHYANDYA